jgi:signal peptidase I
MKNINFDFILLAVTFAFGLIYCVDKLVWHSNKEGSKSNWLINIAKEYFWVLFAVLIVRSFIVSPFYVPTGSLEPTIQPIEFVLVNQFYYGLKIPVFNVPLIKIKQPKTGDIAVFHWPVDPRRDLIKRVIGMPGDKISYIDKVLYINGKQAKQKFLGYGYDSNGSGFKWKIKIMEEDLNGVKHKIYLCADAASICNSLLKENFYNVVVPKDHYFFMGDNRDNSDDSRGWGFAAKKDLVGKAMFIFASWDPENHRIRWHRFGERL